ncbi:MAG TPA: hypothetical protein VMR62_30655 [Bryobacteraceae bacterium]|nr:hypothetical protein [Bryobacteraceae bacterium]
MHQLKIRVVDGFKFGPCVLQEIIKQFSACDALHRPVGGLATRLLSENLIAQALRPSSQLGHTPDLAALEERA